MENDLSGLERAFDVEPWGRALQARVRAVLPAVLLSLLAAPAWAFPNYAFLYKSTFSYLPSCLACHEQESWEPNGFGKQFLKAGRDLKAFAAIQDADGDQDGITNYLEIAAKANPGDPASRPGRTGDWLRDAGIRPPKKNLAKAFPAARTYRTLEYPLTEDARRDLEQALGAPAPDESRFSVLFPAFAEKDLQGIGTYLSVDLPGHEGHPTLLFIGSDRPGRLSFLKLIEYEGSRSLRKEKAWSPLLGKSSGDILKGGGIPGPAAEVEAFKKAVVRGLLVIASAWQEASR